MAKTITLTIPLSEAHLLMEQLPIRDYACTILALVLAMNRYTGKPTSVLELRRAPMVFGAPSTPPPPSS